MFSNPVNFIFYSCSKRCFKYQKSFTKSNLSCDNPKKMFALKTYALIIANFFFLVSLWHNTSDNFSVANSSYVSTQKNCECNFPNFFSEIPRITLILTSKLSSVKIECAICAANLKFVKFDKISGLNSKICRKGHSWSVKLIKLLIFTPNVIQKW